MGMFGYSRRRKTVIVWYNFCVQNNGPSWKYRRRAVFGSMIFSSLVILYSLWFASNEPVAETALLSAFGLMGAVTAAYIGGSAYEDVRLHTNEDEEEIGEY